MINNINKRIDYSRNNKMSWLTPRLQVLFDGLSAATREERRKDLCLMIVKIR